MKPQVDFYLISEKHSDGQRRFACRLLEKAYNQHHSVLVLCEDELTAHAMDELLWVYTDTSFIPHQLVGENITPPPPIQIGTILPTQLSPSSHILLLLSSKIPVEFHAFKRVIEIIIQDDEAKEKARTHYRYFREQGCALNTHDLQKKST